MLIFKQRAKADSAGQAEEFYDKYIRLIVFLAHKYAHAGEDSEDLVQETWLHLLEHMATLQTLSEKQVAGYIDTTIKRLCWHRQNRIAPDELPEDIPDFHDPDERLHSRQALDALSPAHRQLLLERYLFGYSAQELAKRYHTSPGNIRTMLYRAKKVLLQNLKEDET